MATEPLELRPTIDRRWLESVAAREPIRHAYALWDLDRLPNQVRFVTAARGSETLGYLLLWHAPPAPPVVQWLAPPLTELLPFLPPPPFLVNGPEEIRPLIHARHRGCTDRTVLLAAAPRGHAPPPATHEGELRRMTRDDLPALDRLVRGSDDPMVHSYAGLDPGVEGIFGGFEGSELVGVARASVRRPEVWFISGVYVRPDRRHQGWGRAVTRAVMMAAHGAGAQSALFVREDNRDARAVYDHLGFRPLERRALLEVGLDRHN